MKEFWKRFRSNRGAVIGLVILAVVIATAMAAVPPGGAEWSNV